MPELQAGLERLRPRISNPDGSFSTERSITVTDERINDGQPTNIPSMFGGVEREEEEAIQRIVEAGGIDPETGRALPSFPSIDEAVKAAMARSDSIGMQEAPRGQPELRTPDSQARSVSQDATQVHQRNNLPVPRQQELRHPREAQQQPRLRAPGNSFLERVSRGDEMPFDVAGTVKAGGDFIRRGAVSAAPDLKGLSEGGRQLLEKALAVITGSRGYTALKGPGMIGYSHGLIIGPKVPDVTPGDLKRVGDQLIAAGVKPDRLDDFYFGVKSSQETRAYGAKRSAELVVDASKSGIRQKAPIEGKGDHLADLFEDLQ
tara:strand:- start:1057 stop:2010 length:954 start_codon:yes stop_codon:yes gene_type:complete